MVGVQWMRGGQWETVRKGRQEQIREASRNGKNGVCLPAQNFCSFPTVRLSRYHHQPSPKATTQWHLGSDMSHVTSSLLRLLSVSCHILASLVRSLCCARSGLAHFQLNSGTDSTTQSSLCLLPLSRRPDFTRLNPSAGRKGDAKRGFVSDNHLKHSVTRQPQLWSGPKAGVPGAAPPQGTNYSFCEIALFQSLRAQGHWLSKLSLKRLLNRDSEFSDLGPCAKMPAPSLSSPPVIWSDTLLLESQRFGSWRFST